MTTPESTAAELEGSRPWFQSLPRLLRTIGGIAVLVSLYTFLVRGWEGSSDLVRYGMFLGHTGLLAAIALVSGRVLREGNGPRILMMLALVSVVVNFAILGAFIFAAGEAAGHVAYPKQVAWSAGSLPVALAVTGAAMLILLPVVWFGFRTLARGISGHLAALFLTGNAALLLPFRDSTPVSILAVLLGLSGLVVTGRMAKQHMAVRTLEGRVAVLLQFLPVGVLLGRSLWLHAPEISLVAALGAMVFFVLRQASLLLEPRSSFRNLLEFASLIPAIVTGACLDEAMARAGLDASFALLSGTAITAALCYELSLRAAAMNALYRVASVGAATLGVVINLLLHGGTGASVVALGVGIAGIVVSYTLRQRALLLGGLVTVAAGLVDQCLRIFQMFDFGYWATLAVAGVLAIVLGSFLEARGNAVRQRLLMVRQMYSQWSY
jgi:hypothetical protein